jgi:cytochrome P450
MTSTASANDFRPDQPDWYLTNTASAWQRMRRDEPVSWYEPDRFWLLTRYDDVRAVSKDPTTFCSSKGFRIRDDLRDGRTLDGLPPSILAMDPPDHTRYRQLVSKWFTPRQIGLLEPRVRELARESVAAIRPGEVVDFVEQVSVPLPVLVIAEIMGVPTSEYRRFKEWSDDLIAANEGDAEAALRVGELHQYMVEQGRVRRTQPTSDLLSTVANGRVDDVPLSEAELGMFGLTFLGAGNETTRNLISGGGEALMANPLELEKLTRDPALIKNAVEEMLRYVSPIKAFARTATRDTEIRGRQIAKDDFLVLVYASANRDEAAFGLTSEQFDVTRDPNPPHVAFGFGQHVCLGANLARLEARVIFEELLARFSRFELAGDIERVPSTMINGVARMPVVFHT